jgi:peptidoglycan hydrolase-like protein with peptidoglycan-binding domain/GH24 family phage-related lysozyme (muramidase)
MRYAEFKLFEAEGQPGYYTVGDSHAEGLAAYSGKPWTNRAKHSKRSTDPMHMAAIQEIPKGSVVVISLGANDVGSNEQPSAIASRVASIVDASVSKGNKTFFVLFPVGTSKSTNPEKRRAVREAIKSAISVPISDLEGQALQSDGVHAQPNVYATLGKTLAKQVPKPATQAPATQTQPTAQSGKPAGSFVISVPNGRRGPAVADIQKALIALGYPLPKHGVDGIRGPETVAAVKKFQTDNGLEVDGDPGPETVAKLNAVLKSKPEIAGKLTNSTEADVKTRPSGGGAEPGSSAIGATPDMDTLEMIKSFEGFAPQAYWDHKQWSIGYGSFAGSNRSKPDIEGTISKERAESMLRDHVQKFSNDVERWNRVGNYKWNEGQKGALISFAYNIGSISQLTDQGKRDNATIAKKMLEYSTASGQVVPGLVNRRRVEQQKFLMNTPELKRMS